MFFDCPPFFRDWEKGGEMRKSLWLFRDVRIRWWACQTASPNRLFIAAPRPRQSRALLSCPFRYAPSRNNKFLHSPFSPFLFKRDGGLLWCLYTHMCIYIMALTKGNNNKKTPLSRLCSRNGKIPWSLINHFSLVSFFLSFPFLQFLTDNVFLACDDY